MLFVDTFRLDGSGIKTCECLNTCLYITLAHHVGTLYKQVYTNRFDACCVVYKPCLYS
jgi:hypothetical protein